MRLDRDVIAENPNLVICQVGTTMPCSGATSFSRTNS